MGDGGILSGDDGGDTVKSLHSVSIFSFRGTADVWYG